MSEDLLIMLPWPLVLIVLDGFEPQLAPHVISAIAEITDETTISVLCSLAADEAREGVTRN